MSLDGVPKVSFIIITIVVIVLLLCVRKLHNQGISDKSSCLLQHLLTDVQFGYHRSADRPLIFFSLVKGASLLNMLCGLVFLATRTGWWGCQLELMLHRTVLSVVSGKKPHQNCLLLQGQQLVGIHLYSWHHECSDDDLMKQTLAPSFTKTFACNWAWWSNCSHVAVTPCYLAFLEEPSA